VRGRRRLITRPNWRTRNRGVPFATVTPGWTLFGQPDGPTQLATTLANDAPDAAVFAFGTNDITFVIAFNQQFGIPCSVEPVVAAYRSIAATAEQNRLATFVALTPTQGTSTPSQHSELVQ
jgi:hypothetical protein